MAWRKDAIFQQIRMTGENVFLPVGDDMAVMLINGLYSATVSLDVASVAAITSAEQTFTVNGLEVGDVVLSVNIPATLNNGLGLVGWRVSALDTLALRFQNSTAGALDPAAANYTIVVARPGADLVTP